MTSMNLVLAVESERKIKLRIPIPKLLQLFRSGNLHAEDLHALDQRSRNVIKRLLLLACLDASETTGQSLALGDAASRLREGS